MTALTTIFLTFRTYGSWLHGDPRGSVDADHNRPGAPRCPGNLAREAHKRALMKQAPASLSSQAREVVTAAIAGVCVHRRWHIEALAVEAEHVHVVLDAVDRRPEEAMSMLKAWSTRRLVEAGIFDRGRKIWAEHGSTRWIHSRAGVERAIAYVRSHAGAAGQLALRDASGGPSGELKPERAEVVGTR